MSDVRLFPGTNSSAGEFQGHAINLEKKLQVLIERHREKFSHVRLVASEYSTGKTHAGRIGTLGIDENFCLTITEYKRNSNANVINQGRPSSSCSSSESSPRKRRVVGLERAAPALHRRGLHPL